MKTPRPLASRLRKPLARSLLIALTTLSSAASAAIITFDSDTNAFIPLTTGDGGDAGTSSAWSPKYGGCLSVTNTNNWSWAARLQVEGGPLLEEMRTCMTNGGVILFDVIVDSAGLSEGDSVSPAIATSSGNGGQWDQEDDLPRITASEVATRPTIIHVSRNIMPNEPYTNSDGTLHLSAASSYFQFSFGRTDSTGVTTYYIDNVIIRPNGSPLFVPVAFKGETLSFAKDSEGFVSVGWEPTVSAAYDREFGGSLKTIVPSATADKSFWWLCRTPMRGKFLQKFNAAITTGGIIRYDLIAPAGTLAGNTPVVFAAQRVGNNAWTQASGNAIAADKVVPLEDGFEKFTVEFDFSALEFVRDNPYGFLGFGISRPTDAAGTSFHIDNVSVGSYDKADSAMKSK